MKDLMNIPDALRIYDHPDWAAIFPVGLKKAISKWKDRSAIKTLSYFGVCWYWICITIFAIVKLYVTSILVFCASTTIYKDFRSL